MRDNKAHNIIQADEKSPFLALFIRTGMIEDGKAWFANTGMGDHYSETIMKIGNIYDYYQNFVSDYEEVMRGWGYCIPDVTADALAKHGSIDPASLAEAKVLDLGCGDGLTGLALSKRGWKRLTAVDFSQPMLDKSAKRGIYDELKQADLMEKLPFEDNSFDLVISTAVTTYISKLNQNRFINSCPELITCIMN